MPIFTGIASTWSPLTTNTTSVVLEGSLPFEAVATAFVPDDAVFVPEVLAVAILVAVVPLCGIPPVFGGSPFLGGLGGRVVTLASGTVSTLVRYSVSMSALTDMPGRKASLSLSRMRTWNLVASCDWLLLEEIPVWLLSFDELATSVTVP